MAINISPTYTFAESYRLSMAKAHAVEDEPSVSRSFSVSPRQTEALIPKDMFPVGQDPQQQEVDPQGQEAHRSEEQNQLFEGARHAAEKANSYMRLIDTHLEFSVSEETGRVVVSVVESDSQAVVRQIPPDSMMQIADRIDQMHGLLFSTQG